MTAALTPGVVFVADFPEHDPSGHEQEGPRPAILVGLPTNAGRPRFPVGPPSGKLRLLAKGLDRRGPDHGPPPGAHGSGR